jgi:hypothetical protein
MRDRDYTASSRFGHFLRSRQVRGSKVWVTEVGPYRYQAANGSGGGVGTDFGAGAYPWEPAEPEPAPSEPGSQNQQLQAYLGFLDAQVGKQGVGKVSRTYLWQWYEGPFKTTPDGQFTGYISDWALTDYHLATLRRCELRPVYWTLLSYVGGQDPETAATC